MANLTKSAANKKYDDLREQLKAGTISQSNFKAAADRLYKMYHGKANAATRNKVGQPPAKPKAAGTKPVNKVPQRFADGAKGGKYDKAVKNKEKAKSNFFRSSSGTRGGNLPSNPKLKSQPKKPKRSSYANGRSGATEYAAALAKYRKLLARIPKVKRKTNRRGRAI